MKPLFKVCAVAKDEGPYLAEWVFHHLHFGFDLIHVYINRTSDASSAVLERINRSHPQVTFEFIDWVDLCDPAVSAKLQTIAYARELDRSRQQHVDWLLFLDIDEFWTPNDFSTTVDRFVATTCRDRKPAPICHLWHCELGQHAPFTPLQRGAGYEMSSHLKTLIPLEGVEIKHVRVHHPIFGKSVVPMGADGTPMVFNEKQPELADSTAIRPMSAYVIHRMYRSEQEYMAMMLRGRPSQRKQLKLNRPGYRSHRNVSVRHRFFWPEEPFRDYDLARRRFLEANDIDSIISQDRRAILKRAGLAVSMIKELLETPDRDRAIAFLRGTRHAVVASGEAPAPAPVAIPPVASEGQLPTQSAQTEPVQPETVQSELAQPEPVEIEAMRPEPAQQEASQPDSALSEPAQPEPIQAERDAERLPPVETRRRRSWFAALVGRS
ncbi:glycosyltransferase family 2 protein [Salinicola sp. CPA57]|uniref:glycosyltransferase family 2 protein n=1 Tax=Salinicola sp. CPA57 TaxID=1949080 RepID=UPI000DA17BEA|nr:glycosyltransferase family 2 protein [Salinicola sp. CPA57]